MFRNSLCCTLAGVALSLLGTAVANATLESRAGGLAYYDTTTDLTWVADANLAKTSGYDADGLMMWAGAQSWIASLNAQNAGLGYLGVNNWRLPTVTFTIVGTSIGIPNCNFGYTGTDCGYNVDLATGEMARMYYGTLDNTGKYNTSGNWTGCSENFSSGESFPSCLTNTGPFSNLQSNYYWSGTEFPPYTTYAWFFNFEFGLQYDYEKNSDSYAWAVRTGDMVPVPGAAWLFPSALAALGWVRRKHIA